MNQSQKWSEQVLVEESFGHMDKDGNEVIKTLTCLNVCISGKELYKKEFIDGKYKRKKMFTLPFDFIVENGDMSPKGSFYELEYFIGERGMVYRALIQAVDPVTDIPLIIGTLKHNDFLPADFSPKRAYLRDDIDAVCIGNCSKDENGEACFMSGHNEAHDGTMDDGERLSVLDYALRHSVTGCNFNYYCGDCIEQWIPEECDCSEKIFVCGVNGNDPEFAEQRECELDMMTDNMNDALATLRDYSVPHLLIWQDSEGNYEFHCGNLPNTTLGAIFKAAQTHKDEQQ